MIDKRGVLIRRSLSITVGVLVFLLLPALGIGVCPAVELMIVESLVPYRVLNKYEQPLSREEKDAFPGNAPFVIVDRDATLGDQLTPAMIVTYKGVRYFFQKDSDGGLLGSSSGGYRRTFRNAVETADTVQLNTSMTAHTRYPQSGGTFRIPDGRLLVRLFRINGYHYVHAADTPSRYGWVRLSQNEWSEPSKAHAARNPTKTTLNETLRERIVAHIDSRNAMYKKYFSSLNEITPRNKAVPQWSIHEEGSEGMTFILSGGPDIVAALEESSRVVAEELGNILLAEQFTARYRDGAIRVHRRQGGDTR